MELITPAERDGLLDQFKRDAFHLELRDDYRADYEDGPVTRWLRGEPDDYQWLEPWLVRVRRAVASGKTIRRVRVGTEPLSAYLRWEHSVTWLNQEAGEAIRWLPRHRLPEDLELPVGGRDFWVFDDELVTIGHFDETGRVLGSELVTDPAVVAACARTRDRLWPLAIPHEQYELV
jgi:hypothetical protein